jgi:2-iminobutanoate/2-iminopropanoate deaminase
MKVIYTEKAPKPVGPYSQAVEVGNFVFISGQIAINPETGKLEGKTAAEQTERILKNIEQILKACGLTLNHVVKTTIYTTDLSKFGEINTVYGKFFKEHKPARVTVGVNELPLGALVEIEAIAVKEI